MSKTKIQNYEKRTINLLQELWNKDIKSLNFVLICKELEIKWIRKNILKEENKIISVYEDINTIEFLISNKKNAK